MTLHLAPVSASGRALHAFADSHPRLSSDSLRPYVGIAGVLIGSILAILDTRVTSFGLADLRGGLHASFDQGAWITTSVGIGQMVAGVASPYLGAIAGVRRILLLGILVTFIASFLGPLSPNLNAFLAMQFLSGIGSGTFIPLTISFIVRSLPSRLVMYGIALFAMNLELSQNVAASLEGWYSDHWSWHWIEWQYCAMLPIMFVCISYGVPREAVNTRLTRELDWPGLGYAMIGFGLLFAALDQGNRLDWRNNGLINGLMISGGIITLAFFLRELTTPRPFMNVGKLMRGNLLLLFLLVAGFRFIILSTAYIIPTYLQAVPNFRELQVGSVLLWIALPQLVLALPLAALLRRTDSRIVLALGNALIAIACWMAAGLTNQWATVDFLPSQILQAMGQSLAFTALMVLTTRAINPSDALAIGFLLQFSRLFGGELGTAFMQTYVRVREQTHSNLVGLHVSGSTGLVIDRLNAYQAVIGTHTADPGTAAVAASKLLASAVAQQAAVLSYIDGFMAAAAGAFACLMLVALMRRPPPSPFEPSDTTTGPR
jgi:MFS transporter, DHA2 family, multidrug resistance protein